MNELDIFEIERPWGNFRQFTKNQISTIKIITVKPNEALSLQKHTHRSEFWHVISGSGIVQIGDVKKETFTGNEHVINKGEIHRLSAGENGILVLEIALGDFNEDDIIHLEDKYGRV